MKKKMILICIFVAACMLLSGIKQTSGAGKVLDFCKDEGERYHPNGSEPVYVGIFGE